MSKKHLKCWLWKILWVLSFGFFVVAIIGALRGGPLLGLDPLLGFWSALVLGVLAIPIKLDCADCSVCRVG